MTRDGKAAKASIRRLSPRDFEEIRELTRRSFGLNLGPGKEEMVSARLRPLVSGGGFRSYEEYCRHVALDTSGEALRTMIDALVTNHTGFLREPEHFQFLRTKLLPAWMGRQSLAAWSAGCSTGEELWTIAFLLNDGLAGRRIHLIGSDISRDALERAALAIYPSERVRELPPAWVNHYFVAENGGCRVHPRIRAQATFRRLNIVEKPPPTWTFPLIFCRNVMIYFDRATQQRVLDNLAASLEPGGYLFLGHAESLTTLDHRLEYVGPAIYRKSRGSKGEPCG